MKKKQKLSRFLSPGSKMEWHTLLCFINITLIRTTICTIQSHNLTIHFIHAIKIQISLSNRHFLFVSHQPSVFKFFLILTCFAFLSLIKLVAHHSELRLHTDKPHQNTITARKNIICKLTKSLSTLKLSVCSRVD